MRVSTVLRVLPILSVTAVIRIAFKFGRGTCKQILANSRRSDAECRAVRSCSMKSPSNRNYISFIGIVGSTVGCKKL